MASYAPQFAVEALRGDAREAVAFIEALNGLSILWASRDENEKVHPSPK